MKEKPNIKKLRDFISHYNNPKHEVTIAMCGKYIEFPDAYKSVMEAFIHAGVENDAHVNLKWIQTDNLISVKKIDDSLSDVDGISIITWIWATWCRG